MSRIGARFSELKKKGEKALVCFITAGDPTLEATRRLVLHLEKAGADIVELGIPFSDPMAEGPSIQGSSMRALESGTNISDILCTVREIRSESQIPIVLMTYYNPVLQYGLEKFAADSAASGVDGAIITDLTPEEAGNWKAAADEHGMDTIFLLAPTSTNDRISLVAGLASGFVYCVSRTGVTGAREAVPEGVESLVGSIRAKTDTPVAVGFGISRPEHVRTICRYADGAIVGSALVNIIAEQACDDPDVLLHIHDMVSALKSATTQG